MQQKKQKVKRQISFLKILSITITWLCICLILSGILYGIFLYICQKCLCYYIEKSIDGTRGCIRVNVSLASSPFLISVVPHAASWEVRNAGQMWLSLPLRVIVPLLHASGILSIRSNIIHWMLGLLWHYHHSEKIQMVIQLHWYFSLPHIKNYKKTFSRGLFWPDVKCSLNPELHVPYS